MKKGFGTGVVKTSEHYHVNKERNTMEFTAEIIKEEIGDAGVIGTPAESLPDNKSLMPCLVDADREYFLEISEKFDVVMSWAKGLVIIDDASLVKATDIRAVLKTGAKALEARRVELLAPLNERKTEIHNPFKAVQSKIENTLTFLTGQMKRYHDEIERKKKAELEEAKRIEEQALKEERDKAIKAAVRSGDQEDIDKVESIKIRQEDLTVADTTPAKTVSRGKFGMSGVRKIPDSDKIQAAVDKGIKIPGIRAWQEWHFEITNSKLIPAEYKKSSLYGR